jgi:hypothetical protein
MLRFSTTERDVIHRPLSTCPPPSISLQTYYLNAENETVSSDIPTIESRVSYPAADIKSEIAFDITFTKYTELAGYAKLSLWMQCHDHDDMDIFVLLGKVNTSGRLLRHVNYPPSKIGREDLPLINVVQCQGPTGMLRASHRRWETRHPSHQEAVPLRTENKADIEDDVHVWDGKAELWHPHQVAEKIPRGEIVKVEFTTWPLGTVFDEGEKMRVRINGRDMCLIEADVCESLLLVLFLGYSKWLIRCSACQSDAECWNAYFAHWRQI